MPVRGHEETFAREPAGVGSPSIRWKLALFFHQTTGDIDSSVVYNPRYGYQRNHAAPRSRAIGQSLCGLAFVPAIACVFQAIFTISDRFDELCPL
jgi:hypothetical protein